MRIPRSTLVMAALTCIPLGLATRDYIRGRTPVAVDDEPEDELEDIAEPGELIGADTATLGAVFGGIAPGISSGELARAGDATAAVRELARARDLSVTYDEADGLLQRITIAPREGADLGQLCGDLLDRLAARWSDNELTAYSVRSWINPTLGLRAELPIEDAAGCPLTFRRYVPVERWIAEQGAVVPVDAIGQPLATLVARLEPRRLDLADAEHLIRWEAPGLGHGDGPTTVTAYITHGKVVALTAFATVSDATVSQLVEHLGTLYGRPTIDDGGARRWTKPQATLVQDASIASGAAADGVLLTIGTIPPE